jgi:molybdopterin converting factor small subunit
MKITVKFSGLFKALAGVEQDRVDVPEETTVDDLARVLGRKYEKLKMESELTFFVVNDKVSNRNQILTDGDQVRIFQMVAGG